MARAEIAVIFIFEKALSIERESVLSADTDSVSCRCRAVRGWRYN